MKSKQNLYHSPDGSHKLEQVYAGEIRFGPEYFNLIVDGRFYKERIFGRAFKWLRNSEYLALQEWLSTDYSQGPNTALVIVDLKTYKWARVSILEGGFINPVAFENEYIVYEKTVKNSSVQKQYEIKLSDIRNWEY